MSIKPNLHNIDRLIRTVVGIGCIYIGFIDQSMITNNIVSILIGLFGIINLIAAAISYCPIYGFAGFSTCPADKNNDTNA